MKSSSWLQSYVELCWFLAIPALLQQHRMTVKRAVQGS
ncbi:unnamed protein product [Chondrus crispus]|uniref:Uncharacterized protein n=1 Tax=Chondrus crispus TaxID=2769 RepID=R7QA84_CHOCR|nr:unnamed protein product [Chondrus crispus]CDF34954.1 unnamed protein product [Chondrus crispus]|eukprot:XP_005714773.1 unnamed protein product [Chondrus crispus]